MKKLSYNNTYNKLFAGYLIFLTFLCFYTLPSHDMLFYYYPWSTHLQLSYYDGPPFIAYIIRLTTTVFGHNVFAINFVGVITTGITCYIVYKIGELLSDKHLGKIAAFMWLVYPFSTTRFIFVTLNYDCLDNLFSLASILFILLYIGERKTIYIYYAGIMLGLLLLSKYTGIVAILGILVYLGISLRKIFINRHFYLAAILCVLIFSPVLLWNYQHDWASFKYQLTAHNWNGGSYVVPRYGLSGIIFYLCSDVLGVMHILILILVIELVRKCKYKSNCMINNGYFFNGQFLFRVSSDRVLLLIVVASSYFVFWLFTAYFAHVAMNYLLPMDSIIIILACYVLYSKTDCGINAKNDGENTAVAYPQRYRSLYIMHILNGIFLLLSVAMLIDRAFLKIPSQSDIIKAHELQLAISCKLSISTVLEML